MASYVPGSQPNLQQTIHLPRKTLDSHRLVDVDTHVPATEHGGVLYNLIHPRDYGKFKVLDDYQVLAYYHVTKVSRFYLLILLS